MADGDILRGGTLLPLYGKDGTILYQDAITMSVSVVISWSGGRDVDICAFYSHFSGATVGYSHGSSIDDGNGFTANWSSGDNTSGGPETITLAYSGSKSLKGKSFEVHANWYAVGNDDSGQEASGGGPATVTATDAKGNTKSYTIMPASNKHSPASSGDPGAVIRFNNNGTIKEIVAA